MKIFIDKKTYYILGTMAAIVIFSLALISIIRATPDSVTISIYKGWNIISSPFEESLNLSGIAQQCKLTTYNEKIWAWDYDPINGWTQPTQVSKNKGVYILSEENCIATLTGTPATFSSQTLKRGWNLISANASFEQIKGDCQMPSGYKIWSLNPQTQQWLNPASTDKLDLRNGYWVAVEKNCALSELKEKLPAIPSGLNPHIYVLEDDGTFDKTNSAAITRKFYEKYPADKYDFIGIHFKGGGVSASTYAYTVQDPAQQGDFGSRVGKNVAIPDGKGGWTIADRLITFGNKSRLLGGYVDNFPFENVYVERSPNNSPINIIDNFYFSLLFHELTHYWGVTIPDELRDALPKNQDGTYNYSHWASQTGSWIAIDVTTRKKYIENSDGRYFYINDCSKEPKQHDFDLYSMGLKGPNEITQKLVVSMTSGQSSGVPTGKCDIPVEVPNSDIRKAFTIQDIIKVLGPRIPSTADAQKDFNIAFVIIVPKGQTLNQKEIDALNWIADKFPITWYKSTEGRSKLNGIMPKDATPPVISNVKTSVTKSSISVSWTTNEPSASFVIYTDSYSIIYPNVITNPPKFSISHEITIRASDWTPLSANSEYYVKVISIDKDYNMSSLDIGAVKTE